MSGTVVAGNLSWNVVLVHNKKMKQDNKWTVPPIKGSGSRTARTKQSGRQEVGLGRFPLLKFLEMGPTSG